MEVVKALHSDEQEALFWNLSDLVDGIQQLWYEAQSLSSCQQLPADRKYTLNDILQYPSPKCINLYSFTGYRPSMSVRFNISIYFFTYLMEVSASWAALMRYFDATCAFCFIELRAADSPARSRSFSHLYASSWVWGMEGGGVILQTVIVNCTLKPCDVCDTRSFLTSFIAQQQWKRSLFSLTTLLKNQNVQCFGSGRLASGGKLYEALTLETPSTNIQEMSSYRKRYQRFKSLLNSCLSVSY